MKEPLSEFCLTICILDEASVTAYKTAHIVEGGNLSKSWHGTLLNLST